MSEKQTRAMAFTDVRRRYKQLGVRAPLQSGREAPNLQPKQYEKLLIFTHGKALSVPGRTP